MQAVEGAGASWQVAGRMDHRRCGRSLTTLLGVDEGGVLGRGGAASEQKPVLDKWVCERRAEPASTSMGQRRPPGPVDWGLRGECSAERKPGPGLGVQLGCGGVWTLRRGVSSECAAQKQDRVKAGTFAPLPECSPLPPEGNSGTRFFPPELKSSWSKDPGRGAGPRQLLAAGQWAPPPQGHASAPSRAHGLGGADPAWDARSLRCGHAWRQLSSCPEPDTIPVEDSPGPAGPAMQLETEDALYVALELVIAALAVAGNVLVCAAVGASTALQTPTNYFLVSLATADVAVGLFAIPFAITISLGFCTDFHSCLFLACFVLVLTQSSIFSLLAVAVDRYLAIRVPLR